MKEVQRSGCSSSIRWNQGIHQLQIRRSRVDIEIVAKSDNTSHIFDEDKLFQGKGIEVALIMEVLG